MKMKKKIFGIVMSLVILTSMVGVGTASILR